MQEAGKAREPERGRFAEAAHYCPLSLFTVCRFHPYSFTCISIDHSTSAQQRVSHQSVHSPEAAVKNVKAAHTHAEAQFSVYVNISMTSCYDAD